VGPKAKKSNSGAQLTFQRIYSIAKLALFFDSIAAWQVNPWPPETGTVDRDLDVAISQFAPRSETMKDKAVHTAVGVVELYPGQKVGTRDGLVPALPIGNPRPMGLCFNCQAVVEDGLSALDAPAPGAVTRCRSNAPSVMRWSCG
jgi:hypothetical protein